MFYLLLHIHGIGKMGSLSIDRLIIWLWNVLAINNWSSSNSQGKIDNYQSVVSKKKKKKSVVSPKKV